MSILTIYVSKSVFIGFNERYSFITIATLPTLILVADNHQPRGRRLSASWPTYVSHVADGYRPLSFTDLKSETIMVKGQVVLEEVGKSALGYVAKQLLSE